jgi:hypothetical protein
MGETKSSKASKNHKIMNLQLTVILAGTAASLALASTGAAQVTADALLNKLVQRGILKEDEAEALKNESPTNDAGGMKFKISDAIKSMELYGDLRFRFEYRSGELGPGQGYDVADRWRYALRIGVRGDLTDDFYYGLRLETSSNERSTWNTFGNAGGSGQSPYVGPFSKANNYTLYVGLAYLGWRPAPWLDVSIGRVPQPLYTTPMVWDSDYTPEGAVEKVKWTAGRADLFGNFAQLVYQDTTPSDGAQAFAGTPDGAYLFSSQIGASYRINKDVSVKIAPVLYNYLGNGKPSAAFSGVFVGQGTNGLNYASNATTSSSLPTLNQTGINNLFIFELPAEVNFKLGSLDARVFGDFAVNLEGNQRAAAAFHAAPGAFPGGVQRGQDNAWQFGMATGNNLGLAYGSAPKKGTWEARAYWQHVEQYALDPNLLDSDFFEGRGNLEGLYTAFAYSISDAIIGTLRYGWAERIDSNLGTGGFNADLPLPNPITKYQVLQVDVTWKF